MQKRAQTKWRLWAVIFMLILLVPILSAMGCWDRREPDVIGIVIMAAFDREPEGGLFRVIVQVANPLGGTEGDEGTGGGAERAAVWVGEAKGHTIYEAIMNLELISTRNLFWTHLSVIVFSEELARQGIRPVLDYLDRERQTRLITHPFVVQGNVRKLLEAQFPMEQVGAQGLRKKHRLVIIERSVSPWVVSLRQMFPILAQPGQELVLPTVIVLDQNNEGNMEEEESNGESSDDNPVQMVSGAVFRGDRLVGFFDDRETSGYMWLTGNVSRAVNIIKCPNDDQGHITVEIFESTSQLTSVFEGDRPRFRLSILAEGRIQDLTCTDLLPEEEFIASINRQVATVIRNEIKMSLEKAQALGSDVFGLGNLLFRTNPREWRRLEDRWQTIFPELVVDIEIKVIVRRTGLILEPITIQ